MKMNIRFILCSVVTLVALSAAAQTTYTWTGSGGDNNLATANNWSPLRGSPANSDLLVFDGSTVPTVTLSTIGTATIGGLELRNSVSLTMGAAATLTIGDASGEDFSIGSGSTLIASGASAVTLTLANGSTGRVNGTISFTGGAHRLISQSAAGIAFENLSIFNANTGLSGNPFGTAAVASNNNIVFKSGSAYNCGAGGNPFGATAPASVVLFEDGSNFNVTTTSAISLSNRLYGNLFIGAAQTVSGAPRKLGSLTINANLTTATSSAFPIGGNLTIANGATWTNGATAMTWVTTGSGLQTFVNNGTAPNTVQRILVGGASELTLGSNFSLNPASGQTSTIAGKLNLTDKILTGNANATLTVRSAQTYAATTADLTAGTVTFTVVDATNFNLGMTVTGTGIAANSIVLSVSSNTISISKPITASGTAVSLTPSWGAGTISTSNTGGLNSSLVSFNTINLNTGATVEINAATTTPFPTSMTSVSIAKLNANASLTLNKALSVLTQLNVSAGTFTTSGNLTLKSSATSTASAVVASGASISGNVTVERYIPSKGRRFRLLASPVQAVLSSAGWQQQIHVTGPATNQSSNVPCSVSGNVPVTANDNGFDATLTQASSIFSYNDGNNGGAKWEGISETGISLLPGQGYRVLVRGPRSEGCSLLDGSATTQNAVTLSATGTLTVGDAGIPPSGGRFQLIGNPYASTIDFSALATAQASNLATAAYWVYDPVNPAVTSGANYKSWSANLWSGDGSAPTGALAGANGKFIASGQAFFIYRPLNNTGAISPFFTTAMQANQALDGVFRTQQSASWSKAFRLLLLDANGSDVYDGAVVRFAENDPGVNNQVMNTLDVAAFGQGSTSLSSAKAGQWLSMNTRAATAGDDTVALRFHAASPGTYLLKNSELINMAGTNVLLRDRFQNTTTPLALNQPVAISVTSNPASQGANRFELIFRSSATLVSKFTSIKASRSAALARNEVRFTAQEDGGTNEYQLEASTNGGQSFEAVSGTTTPGSKQAGQFSYQLNDERAITATQTVYYRIKATGIQTSYSQVVKVDVKGGAELTVKAYPNPVTDVLNIQLTGTTGQMEIRLLDAQGRVVLSQRQTVNGQETISLATKQLAAGKYLLQATGKGGETLATQSIMKE